MRSSSLHGGQDYDIPNFTDDFSVTTNYLGPSPLGLEQIQSSLHSIQHYPKESGEPHKSIIAKWLFGHYYSENDNLSNFLLGNGASELIDLLIRSSGIGQEALYYVDDPQYMEYDRSCKNASLKKTSKIECADIICIVNPCNPSGNYLNISELKSRILECKDGATVVIDESMQLWKGADFREDSLVSQCAWIRETFETRGIRVALIHSWTKFFACTGIRIGSIWLPIENMIAPLLRIKTPWSCNILALEYLSAAVQDKSYITQVWNTTGLLRTQQAAKIIETFPSWKVHGVEFLSWMWIECPNSFTAIYLTQISKQNGTPIRWGGMGGYNRPSFIRIAVRKMEAFDSLLNAWKSTFAVSRKIATQLSKCSMDELICHEEIVEDSVVKLCGYLETLENYRTIPAILVDETTRIIIDGHHRYAALKRLGLTTVDVVFVDYTNPSILVNVDNLEITKQMVLGAKHQVLPAKTTRHAFISNGAVMPIICMSKIVCI
jgi:histidinol-phosphate/aromatic aminotransferase/cobyric acid decarboxylase-like protein